MIRRSSGLAIRFVPEGSGVPGLLCDYSGDVIFLDLNAIPTFDHVISKAVDNLPGTVLGIFTYIDKFPSDPLLLPFYPEEAMFNYA